MKSLPLVLALLAPLALSACGVPDLVAHGVKTYEKSQQPRSQAEPVVAQPAQPAYQPARYEPRDEPTRDVEPMVAPQRESISAEPLR